MAPALLEGRLGKITGRDRMEAALGGLKADRPPFSLWTHLPYDDLSADTLTRKTVEIRQRLELDFVKSMPNAFFCGEPWGVVADYSRISSGGVATVPEYPIRDVEDWDRVRIEDESKGALGRELRHLEALVRALGPDVPVLATVFAPTTVARKIAGGAYRAHLEERPQTVTDALARIAVTMRAFAERAIDVGCAGVYFATQEAGQGGLTGADYARVAVPFDIEVLSGCGDGWCNVLHIHGSSVYFDLLKDYPVHALSWHTEDAEPTISAYAAEAARKVIMGGLRRRNLTGGDMNAVAGDLHDAMTATGGERLVLAPTCTVHHPFDLDFLSRVGAVLRGEGQA